MRTLTLQSADLSVMLWMVSAMFTPSLGTIAAWLVARRGFGGSGLRWGCARYHLVAWLLPFGVGLVAAARTVAFSAGRLELSGRVTGDSRTYSCKENAGGTDA